jgi:hypothetical protein
VDVYDRDGVSRTGSAPDRTSGDHPERAVITPGAAGAEAAPGLMDERRPVHAEGSLEQDDDSAWPHPCHCRHVEAWMGGISSRLDDTLAERAEAKPRRERRKPRAAKDDKP